MDLAVAYLMQRVLASLGLKKNILSVDYLADSDSRR